MTHDPSASTATREPGVSLDRWTLIRDLVVFQLKLGIDALRDLLWSPLSLAAAAIDLFSGASAAESRFHRLLALGRRTEHAIGLFGTGRGDGGGAADAASVDLVVRRLEGLLVEQYSRGGVTASAKDAIDRALDAVGGRSRPPGRREPDA